MSIQGEGLCAGGHPGVHDTAAVPHREDPLLDILAENAIPDEMPRFGTLSHRRYDMYSN
jgi:hypothetical protein